MIVKSENYKGFLIAVHQMDEHFVCYIANGDNWCQLVEQYTDESGLRPTKLFASKSDAVEHAKLYINSNEIQAK